MHAFPLFSRDMWQTLRVRAARGIDVALVERKIIWDAPLLLYCNEDIQNYEIYLESLGLLGFPERCNHHVTDSNKLIMSTSTG